MSISKLKIENIRGIQSGEYELNIPPNNPIILVAPNGYGKTSIATAFASLKTQKLEVSEEDKYENDISKKSRLEFSDNNGNIYYADESTNTINREYSIFTIRGQVKPKATNISFGNVSRAKSSLVIDPIILYKTTPKKEEFCYSFTEIKNTFSGSISKLLINLSTLLKRPEFVNELKDCKSNLLALFQVRNKKLFGKLFEEINNQEGTKQQLLRIEYSSLVDIEANSRVVELVNKIGSFLPAMTTLEKIANIYQLAHVSNENSDKLNDISKYYSYLAEKNKINSTLKLLNCTWKSIKASQKSGTFVIEFPKADQISNGERDVLCFVGKLFEASKHLKKSKCILIIDEIFDYLDDANLIVAQYFLIQFINSFKSQGKEIYPIILTHLDPLYFQTYSFPTKNVVYLNKITANSNKYKINNLLKERNNCRKSNKNSYDIISNNYLHYSEDNTEATAYLTSINVEAPLHTPESFRNSALLELENYKNDRAYDIALVCCAIRIVIEKNAYSQLPDAQKEDFINLNKTIDKLKFAKDNGADVPEIHFLLSIIYNECMHLDDQCKKLRPIDCKLKNKVIKNMIKSL